MKERAFSKEKLSRHSTIRIGGEADLLFLPSGEEELLRILEGVYAGRYPRPVTFFGKGSNILFSDRGLYGTSISTKKMSGLRVLPDGRLLAQAGVSMPYLSRMAALSGCGGFSFMAGIPGTVGGGVAMNAGTPDGDFKTIVEQVRVVTPSGTIETLQGPALDFGYRHSIFAPGPGAVGLFILDVLLRGEPGDPVVLAQESKDSLARRNERQPLDKPSLGSVFRNPVPDHAGRLIEASGLRGIASGGIRVSPKHCNFFVNEGSGTASEFLDLLDVVRGRVHSDTGQNLVAEVEVLSQSGRG